MNDVYYYEYRKDQVLRLSQDIIYGFSHRYLWHTELELMVVLEGDIEYYADEKRYHLKKGDVIFFNENCGHTIFANGNGNCTVSLKLHPDVLRDWGFQHRLNVSCSCITQENQPESRLLQKVYGSVADIFRYFEKGTVLYDRMAETTAARIFLEVLLKLGSVTDISGCYVDNQRKSQQISIAEAYIVEHLTEHITLQEAADVAGYNKSYFSTLFKQQTGLEFRKYINRIRVQKAIGLLEKSTLALTDIATESGFSDYNAFSTCIKKYCGRKPQEYRAEVARSKSNSCSVRHYAVYPDAEIEKALQDCLDGVFPHTHILPQDDQMKRELRTHIEAISKLLGTTK